MSKFPFSKSRKGVEKLEAEVKWLTSIMREQEGELENLLASICKSEDEVEREKAITNDISKALDTELSMIKQLRFNLHESYDQISGLKEEVYRRDCDIEGLNVEVECLNDSYQELVNQTITENTTRDRTIKELDAEVERLKLEVAELNARRC